MKTKIIVLLLVAIGSIYAQNHNHYAPYRSQYEQIIRMGDSMYKETTTIQTSGLSSTTIVENKLLYTIPIHLQELSTNTIDNIVSKHQSFTTITWSWFVIWECTYTKDAVYNQFSWLAIRNLLIGNSVIILVLLFSIFLAKKEIKETFRELKKVDILRMVYQDKDSWLLIVAYEMIVSILAFVITGAQNKTAAVDTWFGLAIYEIVLGYAFYLVLLFKKQIFKTKNKNL